MAGILSLIGRLNHHMINCMLCQPERQTVMETQEVPNGGDDARPARRGAFRGLPSWAEEDEVELADRRADVDDNHPNAAFDRPVRVEVRLGRRASRSRSPVRGEQAPDWHCNTQL